MSNFNNQGNGFGPMMDNGSTNNQFGFQNQGYQFGASMNPPRYGDIQNAMTNQMGAQNYGANQRRQPTYLPGRIIQSENEIMAYEVPNDGNIAAFIQKDLQTVYLKTVLGDGLVHTNEYRLVTSEEPTEPQQNPFDMLLERFDRLEAEIKEMKTQRSEYRQPKYKEKKPYVKPNTEKEGTTNER